MPLSEGRIEGLGAMGVVLCVLGALGVAGALAGCGGRDAVGQPGAAADMATADAPAPPPGEVRYRAELLFTALNRIAIYQSDEARDLCTFIVLVEPGVRGLGEVQLPEGWALERGSVSPGSADCAERGMRPGLQNAAVVGATGAIGLDRVGTGEPCGVDLEVTLELEATDGWAPRQLRLEARDVPLFGSRSCLD
jgi:hypothetical protein